MAGQERLTDWWNESSDRERQGALLAMGGTIAVIVGVTLLPWLEASSTRAGTARESFFDVMSSLQDIKDELSMIESVLLGSGSVLPALGTVLVLFFAWAALIPAKGQNSETSPMEAAGALLACAVYFGWVILAVNRDLKAGEDLIFALGIDAHVGIGAWVTLAGLAAIAGGVLYGTRQEV